MVSQLTEAKSTAYALCSCILSEIFPVLLGSTSKKVFLFIGVPFGINKMYS